MNCRAVFRDFLGLGTNGNKEVRRKSFVTREQREGSSIFLNRNATGRASSEPVIDDITIKLTASWRKRDDALVRARDFRRVCSCGVQVQNKIYLVGEHCVGPLALHLVAYHRESVSKEDLDMIMSLNEGMISPVISELIPPKKVLV